MLYRTNGTTESMIEPYDFMVICDVCLRVIHHVHIKDEDEVLREGRKDENVCLKCQKKGFHWKAWHGRHRT